jgi:SAM-dependent methyltransferase
VTPADQALLARLLGHDPDLAYRRRARAMLDYLELEDGLRVFDCGCGMGFFLQAMARLRRLRLVGLDMDHARLAQGSRAGVPASLLVGDVERLPFADATFDRVLMSEVLEHLASDSGGLREVFRVTQPGGVLAVSVPHARYPFWWDPINRVWASVGGAPIREGPLVGIWTGHQRLYTPEQLAERVTEAGFVVERLEQATHYAFPFSHFLLYGVGKPLLESGLLPASVDRLAVDAQPSALMRLGMTVFEAVDRLNERSGVKSKGTFVNVLLKARRP